MRPLFLGDQVSKRNVLASLCVGVVLLSKSSSSVTAQTNANAPEAVALSAEHVAKSVRTLPDGNVVEQTTNGRFYRDSVGRTRSEQGRFIAITDPAARTSFVLDTQNKTARKMDLSKVNREPARASDGDKAQALTTRDGPSLGTKRIEGVTVTGKTIVKTIAAESPLGNQRPIEIVMEVWTSEALQLPILTVTRNPLSGETTQGYRNIVFNEPDPALFVVPEDYKVMDTGPGRP